MIHRKVGLVSRTSQHEGRQREEQSSDDLRKEGVCRISKKQIPSPVYLHVLQASTISEHDEVGWSLES